jgi:hypothetical protein
MNLSESRALRRGGTILKDKRNGETGEVYTVEVKYSWSRFYYRMPCQSEWYRTPGEARRAEEEL